MINLLGIAWKRLGLVADTVNLAPISNFITESQIKCHDAIPVIPGGLKPFRRKGWIEVEDVIEKIKATGDSCSIIK